MENVPKSTLQAVGDLKEIELKILESIDAEQAEYLLSKMGNIEVDSDTQQINPAFYTKQLDPPQQTDLQSPEEPVDKIPYLPNFNTEYMASQLKRDMQELQALQKDIRQNLAKMKGLS